jgi:hypothetical protein
MINPELEDRILKYLINNVQSMDMVFNIHEFAKQLDVNIKIVDMVLVHFEEKELIEYYPMIGGKTKINLKVNGLDYYLGGGHLGEIENMELEARKLKNKIESIEHLISKTKFSELVTIVNSIIKYFAARYSKDV